MPSQPETSTDPLEAILASLRTWIFRAIALLAEILPLGRSYHRDLRAYLRKFEYDLKRAIFLRALARMTPPKFRSLHRPAPGYALRRVKLSALRCVTHGTFHRIPRRLHARLAHLRAILDDIEGWTARLLKRLLRGFNGAARILAAPPVARVVPQASPLAPAHADTPSALPSPDMNHAAVRPNRWRRARTSN